MRKIQELASLGFVERVENVVMLGPSGTDKTHLAIAFGLIAAHKGWKVRFMSAADLVIALEAVQRQGRMKEVMDDHVVAQDRGLRSLDYRRRQYAKKFEGASLPIQ